MGNNNHSDCALRSALSTMDDELLARMPMPADIEQRVMQRIEASSARSRQLMWYRRIAAIGAVAAVIAGLAVVIGNRAEQTVTVAPAQQVAVVAEPATPAEPQAVIADAPAPEPAPRIATPRRKPALKPMPAEVVPDEQLAMNAPVDAADESNDTADEPAPVAAEATAPADVLSEAERAALIDLARQRARQAECVIIDAILQQQAMQQQLLESCSTDSCNQNRHIYI